MNNPKKEIQVPLSLPIDVLTEIPSNCKTVKKLNKQFIKLIQLDEFKKYSLFISKKYFLTNILELMIKENITFKEAEKLCRNRQYDVLYYCVIMNMKDNYMRSSIKKALMEEMEQLKENENVINVYLSNITLDMQKVLEESLVLYRAQKLEKDLMLKKLFKNIFTSMKADVEIKYFSFSLGFVISEVIKVAIKRNIKFSEATAYFNFDMREEFLDYIGKIYKNSTDIKY